MLDLYRKRWEIETLFAALKSRGFGLEDTHMTEPDRIRKLLGVLAVTYSWTRLIGLDRKATEGAPRECANGYPEKSLFLLWTGSAPGAYDQLASDERGTSPMRSGAYRSSLIFVV
ncbi:hypothetical protein GGP62_000854 [Salinibacter ruber]|nr:transposase [Salinibacter ruber]MCS3705879.1 hypothetical protein [Salinibacter ruber]